MGDGTWDSSSNRLVLCIDNFTIAEINYLQQLLLDKYGISSNLMKSNENQYRIRISRKENIEKIRALCLD
jgi:hypothetical protein